MDWSSGRDSLGYVMVRMPSAMEALISSGCENPTVRRLDQARRGGETTGGPTLTPAARGSSRIHLTVLLAGRSRTRQVAAEAPSAWPWPGPADTTSLSRRTARVTSALEKPGSSMMAVRFGESGVEKRSSLDGACRVSGAPGREHVRRALTEVAGCCQRLRPAAPQPACRPLCSPLSSMTSGRTQKREQRRGQPSPMAGVLPSDAGRDPRATWPPQGGGR